VTLSWSSAPGKRYRVSYSDDLITWHLLGTPVSADSETGAFSNSETVSSGRRFYRVNVIP
jgi:hypothetical protein